MEKHTLLISIIVPFYNEEKYIRQCVESLINQDFDRNQYELIFVDNNSSDGSRAIVEEYRDVALLTEMETGAYAARNCGAIAAKGEILAFTDADAIAGENWLLEVMTSIDECLFDFVIGNHRFSETASGFLRLYENHESQKMEYVTTHCNKKYCLNSAANMAIRKESFHEAGLFNPGIQRGGDIEFAQRYVEKMSDPKITYNKAMVVHHCEIRNLKQWFGKRIVYARSRGRVRKEYFVKTLPFSHRVHVFKNWFSSDPAPVYRKCLFIFVLFFGVISWKCIEWPAMAFHAYKR